MGEGLVLGSVASECAEGHMALGAHAGFGNPVAKEGVSEGTGSVGGFNRWKGEGRNGS